MTHKDKYQIEYWAHMLDECFNKEQFLCEDKEGKNINRAEKWIKQNHPEVIGQKLENGTTITPRILTQEIRNTVPKLDEAFGGTYSIKTYPAQIEKAILNNNYHPKEFNDKYGEWTDADAGFITPYGTIIHNGGENHHYALITTVFGDNLNSYAQQLAKICKNRSLDDIKDNSDDSVLVADALDHGLIRFDAEDSFVQFGKTITSKSLDMLYDFVDYIMQQEQQIKSDIDGEFSFYVAFDEGINPNGDIIYSGKSITYSSLDEFSKRFINDVKANVNIISQ